MLMQPGFKGKKAEGRGGEKREKSRHSVRLRQEDVKVESSLGNLGTERDLVLKLNKYIKKDLGH